MRIEEGIDMGVPVLKIGWETGEFESFTEDIRRNYENLGKLKPEHAIIVLRLYALHEMNDTVYRELRPDMTPRFPGSSILSREFDKPAHVMDEEEIFLTIFGGTNSQEQGLIMWQLANAISQKFVH